MLHLSTVLTPLLNHFSFKIVCFSCGQQLGINTTAKTTIVSCCWGRMLKAVKALKAAGQATYDFEGEYNLHKNG